MFFSEWHNIYCNLNIDNKIFDLMLAHILINVHIYFPVSLWLLNIKREKICNSFYINTHILRKEGCVNPACWCLQKFNSFLWEDFRVFGSLCLPKMDGDTTSNKLYSLNIVYSLNHMSGFWWYIYSLIRWKPCKEVKKKYEKK